MNRFAFTPFTIDNIEILVVNRQVSAIHTDLFSPVMFIEKPQLLFERCMNITTDFPHLVNPMVDSLQRSLFVHNGLFFLSMRPEKWVVRGLSVLR